MNETLKAKLSKIYELVNRGATEGEKAAAKKALDRIIDKYKLTDADLQSIHLKKCKFAFVSNTEVELLCAIVKTFSDAFSRLTIGPRAIYGNLNHLEWVTIDCAYQYYRRHMKAEWNRVCLPEINRCRKPKTIAKRRKELQRLFSIKYIIASNLIDPAKITTVKVEPGSKEYYDRVKLSGVQGGNYNKQLQSGLLLN